MASRITPTDDAARRARRQLDEILTDLRAARLAAGLSQAAVARAMRCSPQLLSVLERRALEPRPTQLARWAAAVGLEISIRAFPGGAPLRDAGQLRLLRRFRAEVGEAWAWRTEVPVSSDGRDRRAIDAVLSRLPIRIGAEAIVRLTDAQAQIRSALLKQEANGLDRMVLVAANTRHNRLAVRAAAPTLAPAFPLSARDTLRCLRAGELPPANGVVIV